MPSDENGTARTTKKTMRAAQGRDYGDIDEMITVEDGVAVPTLDDIASKDRKNWVIVRTLAVSLAPGDCRVLSGKTRELQGPPSFPYVPGGDVCGVVVEVANDEDRSSSNGLSTCGAGATPGGEGTDAPSPPLKVGDTIAARFHEKPMGALGEYAAVHTGFCDRVPDGVSPLEAAAIGSSGTAAACVAEHLVEGDRIIVFGAGGGLGSHVVQHARRMRGASYIVGVSRSPEWLTEEPLCCDRAVDYTRDDPFEMEEFLADPFDVVIDLAGGVWPKILDTASEGRRSIVKTAEEGGRYLTTTPDEPIFEAHSMWRVLNIFLFPALHRALYSRTTSRRKLPKYSWVMGLPSNKQVMTDALTLAKEGKVVSCIDPEGPFPFTTEGVRRAFRLQESRHIKGKVVIQVAEK